MNSGHTTERVYDALKRRLKGGEFRPGTRLDPALLSETLGSSVTPVRDALNLLIGERLIETRTGEGFHLPHITEMDLRDLYAWNAQVLGIVLRAPARRSVGASADRQQAQSECAVAAMFKDMADRSANAEHRRVVASVSDRLAVARSVETSVLGNFDEEVTALRTAWAREDFTTLRRLIVGFHRRRDRAAAEIIRAINRDA